MEVFYSFTDDVDNLQEKIHSLKAVITRTLEQTIEYGIFFREYTTHGFAGEWVMDPVEPISSVSK